MDEPRFWDLIQDCRDTAGADSEQTARLIWRRLRALRPEEIRAFERHWDRARAQTYVRPVWDAATLLFGSFDDRGYLPIQDWIVSHGRAVLSRVIEDPDNLIDLVSDSHNVRMDWFSELPLDAHIAVAGCAPAQLDPVRRDALHGVSTDLSDEKLIRARFPRLTAYRRGYTRIDDSDATT